MDSVRERMAENGVTSHLRGREKTMTHTVRGYVPLSTAGPDLNLGASALEILSLRLQLGVSSGEPRGLTWLGLRHLLAGVGGAITSRARLAALEQWADEQIWMLLH